MIRHNLPLRIPFDSLKQKVIRIKISKLEDEMFPDLAVTLWKGLFACPFVHSNKFIYDMQKL